MNHRTFIFALTASTLVATFSSLTARAAESPVYTCQPTLQHLQTEFPESAIAQGEHGTAVVAVRVDRDGRVTQARIAQSSGHAALDNAALTSAQTLWRFSTTGCDAKDLLNDWPVAVRFERSAQRTLSFTRNPKARKPASGLAQGERCDAEQVSHDVQVLSCSATEVARTARTSRSP